MARFFSGFHGGCASTLEEGILTSQSFQDVIGTPWHPTFVSRCGVGKEESQAEAEELPLGVSCGFESWPEG